MAKGVMQARKELVHELAVRLGATAAACEKRNEWEVAVAGRQAGAIRYHPRARVWLATTGKESTVGDLTGCLWFVIRRATDLQNCVTASENTLS